MSAEANKTIVQRYYEDIENGRKLELLDEFLAPDFRGTRSPGQTEGGRDSEATCNSGSISGRHSMTGKRPSSI